ncbi:MAG: hypothetical protein QNK36_22205 [Colwellia sp.]|nr:hypothetical protein [Colwellia sp.]
MAEKDKLSKEVEEQIQSLASEVYIQIEEKLTQLISTVMPKESAKKIKIEQEPAYLTLQNDYQKSQNELAEKSKNLTEQILQLEQNTSTLKKQLEDERSKQENIDATLKASDTDSAIKLAQLTQENIDIKQQLADEIDKQEGSELNFQVELTQININFTETIERLEHENTLLKSTLTQEQEKLSSEQQSLETKLSEKMANSSHTIEQLEQALSAQEQSLTKRLSTVEEERNNSDHKLKKAEASWKKANELQTNSLAEQKNKIKELTKQLNTSMSDLDRTQVQHQQQTAIFKQESEQKASQLTKQLQQSQIAEEKQQKVVVDQEAQLVDFDEKIKQKIKEEQDYIQAIKQLNNEQSQIMQQQLADKKANNLQHKQHQQARAVSQQQLNQLEIKNQELTNSLITEQADIKLYQKEVSALKSKLTLAQEGQENTLNRFSANREKQEKDNDQVRETIKYLRDENNNMITQNNIQKEHFIEKISELEHKLTEYRLKFEYAQKQLTQNS